MNQSAVASAKTPSRYLIKRNFCGTRNAQEVVTALIKVHR